MVDLDLDALDFHDVYDMLKDFQLSTVEHAVAQLFAPGGSRRFLVADEVGLGKTLVAKGVIARTIERHRDLGTDRIDVVYICSNGDIARQNVRRLNVIPGQDFALASRLTLLPRDLHQLDDNRINFVSFTPGTTFNLRSAEGRKEERALIHNMLHELWDDDVPWGYDGVKVFAGSAGFRRFRDGPIQDPKNERFDASLLAAFRRELQAAPGGMDAIKDEYIALRAQFCRVYGQDSDRLTDDLRRRRADFVGHLRQRLAHACVDALEPDLIILDEFQRFKSLFDRDTEAGELADALFSWQDQDDPDQQAAVLLLSATPYKMYTRASEGGDDHYADFLHTIGFLLGDDQETLDRLAHDISRFRRALLDVARNDDTGPRSSTATAMDQALDAKAAIESTLRPVMSRNERLAATPDRSGMLVERPAPHVQLAEDDVERYVTMARLGERIDAHGAAAYWASAPHPLTYMDDYVFTRQFERAVAGDGTSVGDLELEPLCVDFDDVESWGAVAAGNPRMRSLEFDVVGSGMWRLLWLPPSLSYYTLQGPYGDPVLARATKRLVFSSWKVVPTAIASHLSYAGERLMMEGRRDVANTPDGRARITALLNFTISSGRLGGMPVVALLFPSVVLARLGDPLEVARFLGARTGPADLSRVLDVVRDRVADALADLPAGLASTEREDQRWYWAAPVLLDATESRDELREWLTSRRLEPVIRGGIGAADEGPTNLRQHLDESVRLIDGDLDPPLGRRPADLADVVAELAVAGPGVVALRALGRGRDDVDPYDVDPRRAAASVAFAIRSLFNAPEVITMLRGAADTTSRSREDAYWRLVLAHCLDGGLQAVMDEWRHVLHDSLGLQGRDTREYLETMVESMRSALMVRTVPYKVRRVARTDDGSIAFDAERMRGHLALRFGDSRAETDTSVQRASVVRQAFNSPFRPFVLATTSVGQEGLDFHTYCHAVVHWNLPSNPVDLEQREGRVHRYKGHAVRRNIAADHRVAAMLATGDPWDGMFDQAAHDREAEDAEVIPYWVYTGRSADPSRIERYVPALPLSRDVQRLENLKRSMAAYRMMMGQPRQDDLLEFLEGRDLDPAVFAIDLRPPP